MAGTGIKISFQMDFPEEEIVSEMKDSVKDIEQVVLERALRSVAKDAKEALMRHIREDVYDKWNPKYYERRYTGSGGLLSMYAGLTEFVSSGSMRLEYLPSGEQYQWENPANNDELIRRIETGRGYEWRKHPGPRPFWNNFVDEMVDRQFADSFDRSMEQQLGEDYIGGTTVEREPIDGVY